MMKQVKKETVSRRELRQFGLGLGLLLGLIGSALLWQGRLLGAALLLFGPVLALACWCDRLGMRAFYVAWMKLALVMAKIMTAVFLTLLFVLLLTPIAFLGRLCGQQFIASGFREDCDSYWQARTDSYERHSSEKQS